MANKHWNGSKPYDMTPEEHKVQAELWEKSGGEIRPDAPHGGANYEHEHWHEPGDLNNDFVVRVVDDDNGSSDDIDTSEEDTDDDIDTSDDEETDDDNDTSDDDED